MQGKRSGYRAVVKGGEKKKTKTNLMRFEVKRYRGDWALILKMGKRSHCWWARAFEAAISAQIKEYLFPLTSIRNQWDLATYQAFVNCHANTPFQTIARPFFFISFHMRIFVIPALWHSKRWEASEFSSCISDTRRKCWWRCNCRKKQVMITKRASSGNSSWSD